MNCNNLLKMTTNETICSLCLKFTKPVHIIDDTIKAMLDVLLLQLQLDFNGNPVICGNCALICKKLCNFKLACIKTEIEYASKPCRNEGFVERYYETCRLCQCKVNDDNSVTIKVLFNKLIIEFLSVFLPEMEFDMVNNKLCKSCQGNLRNYFKIVQKCLATEGEINILSQNVFKKSPTQMLRHTQKHDFLYTLSHDKNKPLNNTCEICRFSTHKKCYLGKHLKRHKDKWSLKIFKCQHLADHKQKRQETVEKNESCESSPSKIAERFRMTIQTKKMVTRVFNCLSRDYPRPKDELVEMCSDYTGMSKSSIYKVLREEKLYGEVQAPKISSGRRKIEIDEGAKSAIRRIVHDFLASNEALTLEKLLDAMGREEFIPKMSKETLRKILRSMNFIYEKVNGKSVLIAGD